MALNITNSFLHLHSICSAINRTVYIPVFLNQKRPELLFVMKFNYPVH